MRYVIKSNEDKERHLCIDNDAENGLGWAFYYGFWSHIFDDETTADNFLKENKVDGFVSPM